MRTIEYVLRTGNKHGFHAKYISRTNLLQKAWPELQVDRTQQPLHLMSWHLPVKALTHHKK